MSGRSHLENKLDFIKVMKDFNLPDLKVSGATQNDDYTDQKHIVVEQKQNEAQD